MDANHLVMLLNNIEAGYDGARTAAREALEKEHFDWSDEADNHEPSYYYSAIGNEIHEFIKEASDGLADSGTLIGIIFADTLNHIDWRVVGEDFYEDAAESDD